MKTKDGSKLLQSQMIMIFGANVADLVVGLSLKGRKEMKIEVWTSIRAQWFKSSTIIIGCNYR